MTKTQISIFNAQRRNQSLMPHVVFEGASLLPAICELDLTKT